MPNDPRTVFVTKHALSMGICECQVKIMHSDGTLTLKLPGSPWPELFWPKHYSLTLEDAVQAAEVMRAKKLAALKRQAEKLATVKIKVMRHAE